MSARISQRIPIDRGRIDWNFESHSAEWQVHACEGVEVAVSGCFWGFLPDDKAAGLIVPSAPFDVEYIDEAANSARCSDVKSSAAQERVLSAERVGSRMGGLKLHELWLQDGYVRS